MVDSFYTLPGIFSDLLTSEKIGDRKFKVSVENLSEIGKLLTISLLKTHEQNDLIIQELKLLNLRFEEMAETKITKDDIEV